jgi:hypothetical protein
MPDSSIECEIQFAFLSKTRVKDASRVIDENVENECSE